MVNQKNPLKTAHFTLIIIFFLAILVRFWHFKESTYFGYDEARDAYISQSIYIDRDIKLIGPPANYPGLYHGPLYWYILGPVYLLSNGDPYAVSAIFRIINALGVFLIYLIAKKLFSPNVAIISALIYAFSFEQTQYGMFVSNPSLAIFAWMVIFLGIATLIKNKNPNGLILMFAGAAMAAQLELIFLYTFILVMILLFVIRREIRKIPKVKWLEAFTITGLLLSTFAVAEIKYHFQFTKSLINLFTTGYHVMQPNDSRFSLYGKMFVKLFQYNILNAPLIYLIPLIFTVICLLLYLSRKNTSLKIIVIWIFASSILLPLGGYDALYINLGIGLGVIVACGFLFNQILNKSRLIGSVLIILAICSNLHLINKYNPDSLIVELKPQPFMKLIDEQKIIDDLYINAKGKAFTIRVTGIPYGIQTTWAYLFNYFGKSKWGYLPYWEGSMIQGYPGHLPTPTKGTTCVRYLIIDPVRGLPANLIEKDIQEENNFSSLIKEEKVGGFTLQTRKAKDRLCHDIRAN